MARELDGKMCDLYSRNALVAVVVNVKLSNYISVLKKGVYMKHASSVIIEVSPQFGGN